jgi:hypothetical protein
MRDNENNIIKWFGTCTDIDDQKRMEKERLTAFAAAQEHEHRRVIEAEQYQVIN